MSRERAEQLDQFAPPATRGSAQGPSDGVMLLEFHLGTDRAAQDAERFVNEQLTAPRVSQAIEEFKREAAELAPDPPAPEPEIIHHPIDEAQQTGESRLLGGAMQIRRPWAPGGDGEDPPAG